MIRKHQETDLEPILDVWHQASSLAHPFLDEAFVEKATKAMREMYIPNSETWVYEEEGKIIGFISMMGNEIAGLFVLPNHQSKGIGKQMVDFISDLHEELEVEVFRKNKIGRAFYDKYGFKIIKQFTHEDSGQEVLRMKLTR